MDPLDLKQALSAGAPEVGHEWWTPSTHALRPSHVGRDSHQLHV